MLFGAWISHGCVAEYPEYFALAQLFDFALGLCSLQAEEAESVSETAEAETVQAGGLFCSSKGFGAVFQLPKVSVFHTNRSLPHLTDSIRSTHLIPGHSPPPGVLHLTLCSLAFQAPLAFQASHVALTAPFAKLSVHQPSRIQVWTIRNGILMRFG